MSPSSSSRDGLHNSLPSCCIDSNCNSDNSHIHSLTDKPQQSHCQTQLQLQQQHQQQQQQLRRHRCSSTELTASELDAPVALLILSSSSGSSDDSDDNSDSNDSDANDAIVIDSSSDRTIAPPPSSKLATMERKRVRWSTITVHEFGVAVGGSTVPSKGGAAIGLGATPEFTWTTNVGEMAERTEGVHRFSSTQRRRLLQRVGVDDAMIERSARETSIILGSRKRALEDDNADKQREEQSRKRSAAQASLPLTTTHERPCVVSYRRPRMIPVNYV